MAVWFQNSLVPSDCAPSRAAGIVVRFIDAFNAGDQTSLESLFTATPTVGAMNPPPRSYFISTSVPQLLEYFAERHRQHEKLRMPELHLYYGAPRVGLGPTVERSADDIVTESAITKGELDCASGKIDRFLFGGWGRSPDPVPTGFVLPASCGLVRPATLTPLSNEWRIDCGRATADQDINSVLAPALQQQFWVPCVRVSTPTWHGNSPYVLSFASAAGELPRLIESQRTQANCT